ncbi:hypothetical protein G6F31_020210 [Rhizopus arrhizus]|nr:hypothetical protein G6F31_020210 [Rhizopus arrhizus]
MAGRDQTEIRVQQALAADALERAVLQYAQQFHLHFHWHVADLIEEQAAGIGKFELTLAAALVGARERAAVIAEQLAFHKADGHRGRIDQAPCLFRFPPPATPARPAARPAECLP